MPNTLNLYSTGIKKDIFLFLAALCAFCSSHAQNQIVLENQNAGTPASTWDIAGGTSGDMSIQGFATDISVSAGQTITFKIDVNTGANKLFTIDIYRIGYYQGNGARLITHLNGGASFTGIAQNPCVVDPAGITGITDCGNWTTTTNWTVPLTAVSGIYLAKLTRSVAGGGGSSHIAFVVKNDASTSDLYFKASDATWQAYNPYGGNSLYVGAGLPNNHASKVSYNRPFLTRSGGGGGGAQEDWFMNSEYPMIRFLEANGYDISYTTDLDLARNFANNVNLLTKHKVFLSVGHDEYWSSEERNAVEAARAAGINIAFFSGNESYWKTRWENSQDGTNTAFRTMVCYKEGYSATGAERACGDNNGGLGVCDVSTNIWTGLWRNGCGIPNITDACKPENALSGNISWDGTSGTMVVPDTYKNLRFWRNSPVALLPSGGTATLTAGTLGYEFDFEQTLYQSSYPPGRVTMSSTVLDGHIHKLSLYKDAVSKALVFGAGTIQWAWGLDATHDRGSAPADRSMQQATINVLADMGAQPGTIQSPLVPGIQSTDVTPPVSVISVPVNGASIPADGEFTISGTATDVGGVVAGVDISLDGGVTWQPATGTSNWTFTWTPTQLGSVTIKSRSYDDIGNLESPGGSDGSSANTVNVTVVTGVPPTNCPCTIFNYTLPAPSGAPFSTQQNFNDSSTMPPFNQAPLTLGVKFKAAFDGVISAVRFFKSSHDTATHRETVQLWNLNAGGAAIGQGTLSDTVTAGHWAEVPLSTPVNITANTVYVASYYSPTGTYSVTDHGFQDSIVNGPLTGVMENDPEGDGPNGGYIYNTDGVNPPSYPANTFFGHASNYWVDVKYTATPPGPDITPPVISFVSPVPGSIGVSPNSLVSVTFNENIDPTTVNSSTLILKDPTNTPVSATVNYTASSRSATLIPVSQLGFSTTYTATVKGGVTDPRIKDVAGNALVQDSVWNFTTAAAPPPPGDDGGGGPILIISNALNPFSRYPEEILRAEGYTAFEAVDISEVETTPAMLTNYDVIILGQMSVSSTDVTLLTNWTTNGGTLIAFRPSALLLPLMGVSASGSLSNGYVLVNTTAGMPGAGIVNQTIQFHGTADLYTLLGSTANLATLFSTSSTTTNKPAITSANVGINGGKAVAFSYDLASSVVYTRQGDPSQAGKSNDGQAGPIRADNLFMPNWLDFSKVQIPQADEQQHLLTNIILLSNLHRKPLPHLWFLPSGFKAAVVMTGDDHDVGLYPGSTGTAGRFNEYIGLSGSNNDPQSVLDWKAIRGTSYLYDYTPFAQDSATYYQNLGFEIALHPTTNCVDFTFSSLNSNISGQLAYISAGIPTMTAPVTNRTHCLPWSDWASQPKIENSLGIRFDVNYYYWPGSWLQNRPGMFTGSGMPMRFADLDGTIIDCYQSPTVITDESQQDIPFNISTLLDNAIGTNGFYGVFSMNMHTDTAIHTWSDAIIAAAVARQVPVVTAKQMLTWLDSRNQTVFSNMTWVNSKLSFNLTTSAHNLQAMVPFNSADGTLISVTQGGTSIPFTIQTVKGIQYGVFAASTNNFVATFSSTPLPITLLDFTVTKQADNAQLNWSTSSEENNMGFEIQRSTDQSGWTVLGFVAGAVNSQTEKDYQWLDKNLAAGTYYYRLRQVDLNGNSTFSKVVSVSFGGDGSLELMQNRPNPFNNTTTVNIVIPRAGMVQLILYDQMGRPVQQLLDEYKSPGTYSIQVNRNGLSSGVYYYRMNALGQSIVRKMTIL
jgi:hypothetical protein